VHRFGPDDFIAGEGRQVPELADSVCLVKYSRQLKIVNHFPILALGMLKPTATQNWAEFDAGSSGD
jgi:hypothetical protein